QPPADPRTCGGGETDGRDEEGGEGDDAPPEVAGRRVERRVQQDGRDEERERQVGLDLELGACRNEGQRGAGDREERRIRNPDTPRDPGQDHRSEEERQRRFEERHVRSLEDDGMISRRGSLPPCGRGTLAECLTTASLVTSMSAGTKRRAARWVTTGTARLASSCARPAVRPARPGRSHSSTVETVRTTSSWHRGVERPTIPDGIGTWSRIPTWRSRCGTRSSPSGPEPAHERTSGASGRS